MIACSAASESAFLTAASAFLSVHFSHSVVINLSCIKARICSFRKLVQVLVMVYQIIQVGPMEASHLQFINHSLQIIVDFRFDRDILPSWMLLSFQKVM